MFFYRHIHFTDTIGRLVMSWGACVLLCLRTACACMNRADVIYFCSNFA